MNETTDVPDNSPAQAAARPVKATGIARVMAAARYSLAGFKAAWYHEAAFRQELMLACLLAPLAFWLGENASQRAILLGSLLVVIITELLNSAIEAAIDRFGGEHHPLSGQAKDLGSAAVFVALVLVVVVWGLVGVERLGY